MAAREQGDSTASINAALADDPLLISAMISSWAWASSAIGVEVVFLDGPTLVARGKRHILGIAVQDGHLRRAFPGDRVGRLLFRSVVRCRFLIRLLAGPPSEPSAQFFS